MAEPGGRHLPPLLGAVSADLRAHFRPELLEYQQYLRDRRDYPVGSKVINDPIWHTIRLESWETAILDSPLVQRLRGIHQLGLAHFVFPGAGYSRFEHSVGALNQTQRFVEAINRNAKASSVKRLDPIQPADEVLVRLAALLHDIGHGFLSHVSERAMGRLTLAGGTGTLKDLGAEAKTFFACRKNPALAEVFAALIVRLPETVDLLQQAKVPEWADHADLADHISHLIVGSTKYANRPFLSEIISGSVDADKLDYMTRDCYMAGLPMPVDVERLLQKVHVLGVKARHLPREYETQFKLAPDDVVQVFAIQESGGRTVEELVVSRVLLYQKLYHHQKIRAMEGMIENAIDLLTKSEPAFQSLTKYFQLPDEAFLAGEWGALSAPKSDGVTQARALVGAVAKRRPLVRAFAFGSTMLSDQLEPKARRQGWSKLAPCVGRGRTASFFEFRRRIVARAREYLVVAGEAEAARKLDESLIVSDLPEVQGIAEKTKFWVGDEHSDLEPYSDRMRVERWAEAYEAQKSVGFVYCPSEHAVAVHLAVRDLIKEETGLEFDDRSLSLTKLRPATVVSFIALLGERKLSIPELVRAPERSRVVVSTGEDEVLRAYERRIKNLATRFQAYQAAEGAPIDAARIVQWLMQFAPESLGHAVRVLESIEYWDRRALADAFVAGLDALGVDTATQLVPLGGAEKSAHHLMYLVPDARTSLGTRDILVRGSVNDVTKGETVVFFDDISASGTQGATAILQLFGRPKEEWEVDERIVDRADDRALDVLRASNIVFLFITGRRRGAEHVVEVARRLVGHQNVRSHIVQPSELGCFQPAARIFQREDQAEAAKAAFLAAGKRALHDKLETWGQAKLDSRALGYANAAALVAFYYNVPTASLTALWKDNAEEAHRWKPLFHRRASRPASADAASQPRLFGQGAAPKT